MFRADAEAGRATRSEGVALEKASEAARDRDAARRSADEARRRLVRLYLTTGTALKSNDGNTMLTIVADTCGRHDTLGGACSAESNTVRYALEKRHMHSCRDNFLLALAHWASSTARIPASAISPRTSISS